MQIRQLFDHDTSTYSYLLWDDLSRDGVIVDSVLEQHQRDSRIIEELGLKLRYALETHVHADHVTGAGRLRERFGCRIGLHKNGRADCADLWLDEGDEIGFGDHRLRVLHTPGHTDTDVCYLGDGVVFTGDTLLIRGTGRTDFQAGDPGLAYDSVTAKLFVLPEDVRVYPGHDYSGVTASSIGEEKRLNPRLGGDRTRQQYIQTMNRLALAPPARIAVSVPGNLGCGMVSSNPATAESRG